MQAWCILRSMTRIQIHLPDQESRCEGMPILPSPSKLEVETYTRSRAYDWRMVFIFLKQGITRFATANERTSESLISS